MKFLLHIIKKVVFNQKNIYVGSTFTIVALLFIYVYSVNATVFNTAERSQIEKELSVLNHEIGELEFELIAEKNNINLELAFSLGFENTDNIKYIPKRTVALNMR